MSSSKTGGVPPILVGTWTYRSFLSNPDLAADFDSLEFGRGNIQINDGPMEQFNGLIYGTGWSLDLKGSITYGNPFCLTFQGKGITVQKCISFIPSLTFPGRFPRENGMEENRY